MLKLHWVALLAVVAFPAGAEPTQDEQGAMNIMIDPFAAESTNVGDLAAYRVGTHLEFRTKQPSPEGGGFFFIRYRFSVQKAGRYTLAVETARSLRSQSFFSYVIDGGPERPVVHKRLVGSQRASKEGWEPEELSTGEHMLELRFHPDQRVRLMNRATEDYLEHYVTIFGIKFRPASDRQVKPPATVPRGFSLRPGDRIVFLGDSITDEEHFPGHFARIVAAAFPALGVVCFNDGIGLNRAIDGLQRLERDVLPLRPSWVVVNYGVNDAMQFPPDEFERYLEQIVQRLRRENINVVCVSPSGFHAERFPDGRYFFTRDQLMALDLTAAYEARAMADVARRHGCLFVDALGILSNCDLPRDRLMANEWHPNSEGGRMMALAILKQLGFTRADAERTGDRRDLEYFKILVMTPDIRHPRFRQATRTAGRPEDEMVAVSSYTQNLVLLFSAASGDLIARIPVGHHPLGLGFGRQRDELYVACEGAATIDIVDLQKLERVGAIQLDDDDYPFSVMPAEGGNEAWVGFRQGVIKADLAARSLGEKILVGGFGQGHALLERENVILAGTSDGLAVVDLAAAEVTRWLPVDYASGFRRLSDTEYGIIDTGNWRMHVLSVPDMTVKSVQPLPILSRAIAAEPDGRALWAGDWQAQKLVKIDIQTGKREAVAEVEFPLGIARISRGR